MCSTSRPLLVACIYVSQGFEHFGERTDREDAIYRYCKFPLCIVKSGCWSTDAKMQLMCLHIPRRVTGPAGKEAIALSRRHSICRSPDLKLILTKVPFMHISTICGHLGNKRKLLCIYVTGVHPLYRCIGKLTKLCRDCSFITGRLIIKPAVIHVKNIIINLAGLANACRHKCFVGCDGCKTCKAVGFYMDFSNSRHVDWLLRLLLIYVSISSIYLPWLCPIILITMCSTSYFKFSWHITKTSYTFVFLKHAHLKNIWFHSFSHSLPFSISRIAFMWVH